MKNIKLKLIVIAGLLLAVAGIFWACEKEISREKQNTEKTYCVTEQVTDNPYAFIGCLHNAAMERILKLTLNQQTVNIYDYSLHFMVDNIPEWANSYSEEWIIFSEETLNHLKDDKTFLNIAHFSEILDFEKFSFYQREILHVLFDNIENSETIEDIKKNIIHIEEEVLYSANSSEEKGVLLAILSIAKYSSMFCYNHEKELSSVRKGPLQNFLNAAKRIVIADAGSAVAGVACGIVQGHATIGMTFGPQGAVVALASDAVAGAIVGSGIQVIKEVTN